MLPCWTILEYRETDSGIVYSPHGHGNHSPWGLVSLSDLWFGMDSAWFLRLEDAFLASAASWSLPIWSLIDGEGGTVATSLTLHQAGQMQRQLQGTADKPKHWFSYPGRNPDEIR